MDIIKKIEIYDKFVCTAGKCPFTCCEGWKIAIDPDTNRKWENDIDKAPYLCKNVKTKKGSEGVDFFIKMGNQNRCPFFNEEGLCNVVVTCGEDYLPHTCEIYPRQENVWENLEEHSLSCGCPATVDLISNVEGKIRFLNDKNEQLSCLRPETLADTLPTNLAEMFPLTLPDNLTGAYELREVMISLMQNHKFSLKGRILMISQMLLKIRENSDEAWNIMADYQNENFLLSLSEKENWDNINFDESLMELNELFLDMVENYKKVKNFNQYLNDISDMAEFMDLEVCRGEWEFFKAEFAQQELLMENCMVSKIFGNCISDDIDDMIMSYQMVITECIMVKYSVFLKWLMNEKGSIKYNDIRNYLVIYTRIIGYNIDGIIEFWEDSFDDAIWDLNYMLLLIS